jgi:DNA-3-methyladenine glycosylase
VYFIYGNHHCMNVVAHRPGEAGAVLLRGAVPLVGLGDDPRALAGPGRLGRAFGLTTHDTGKDLVRSALHVRAGEPVASWSVLRSERIGIARSATSARLWRFAVRGSPGVTR